MADYTITLTDTQVKALETVMVDIDEWVTNAITNRARLAKEDIIAANTAHCNKFSIAIATGEAAQINQAYDLNVVKKLTG